MRTDFYNLFRSLPGLHPYCFLNAVIKLQTIEYPESIDISFMGVFVFKTRSFAFTIFWVLIHL